jgi:hypothetical protein
MVNSVSAAQPMQYHMMVHLVSRLGLHLPAPFLHIPGRLIFYKSNPSKSIIVYLSSLELMFSLAAGCVVAIAFGNQLQNTNFWIWGLVGIAFGLIIIQPRVISAGLRILKIQNSGHLRYRDSLEWLGLFILVWLGYGLSLYFMIAALFPAGIEGLPVAIAAWGVSGVVATASSFFPFSLGLRELTLSLLLVGFMPNSLGVAVAILNRFLMIFYDLIYAGISYLIFRLSIPKAEEGEI